MTLSKATINNWTDEVLKCRSYGHQWKPTVAHKIKGGFESQLVCERCDCLKTLLMDNRGRLEGSRFTYPDGYAAPKGTGNLDADDRGALRIAVINILGITAT